MIAVTRNEVQAQTRFRKAVKPYLEAYKTQIRGLKPYKAGQRKVVRLGERVFRALRISNPRKNATAV